MGIEALIAIEDMFTKTKDDFIIQNTLNNQDITRNKEGGLMATSRLLSSIA